MSRSLMLHRCKHWLRDSFWRREDGVVTVEVMIIIPIIFWAWLAMFAIHDAFRAYSIHQKAAYSIGDAISRETVPIDAAYLNGTRDLFEYMAHSQGQTSMRVSQIWYDAVADEYNTDWSEVRGSLAPLTDATVNGWHDKLPVVPDNERIVLFETKSDYEPPFDTGLTDSEIRTFVFTRPRYAPVVCFEDCN